MDSEKVYETIGNIPSFYDGMVFITGYKKSIEHFVFQLPFSVEQPIRVLDAGCGTGFYLFAILQRFPNATVVGFDTGEKLIQHVQLKLEEKKLANKARVFVADIQGPLSEIEHEQFDVIVTAGVLEYVPQEKTIQNLARFLVPGGYFYNVPVRDSVWGKLVCKVYACTPYSSSQNITAFKNSGLELQESMDVPKTPSAAFREAHLFKKK